MFGERCNKPHQTGMESKWEEWVLAMINFLAEHGVHAYHGGWNANSLEGMNLPKGKVLEVPARLNLLKATIAENSKLLRDTRERLFNEKEDRQNKEANLAVTNALLERCYLASSGNYDARENLEVNDAVEAYAKEHMPHLFEEEEEEVDDDNQRSA